MAITYTAEEPKKSTAARKDVHHSNRGGAPDCAIGQQKGGGQKPSKPSVAGIQALPVDTLHKPKMGRPRTGYVKAEYNRQYSADKRAADKLGVSVKEYRTSKACPV